MDIISSVNRKVTHGIIVSKGEQVWYGPAARRYPSRVVARRVTSRKDIGAAIFVAGRRRE